jgi:hypothetical protein
MKMKKIFSVVCFFMSVALYGCKDLSSIGTEVPVTSLAFQTSYNGSMSRSELESYLSRSITQSEYLTNEGPYNDAPYTNPADDNRMLKNIGAKFIGRSIYMWGSESRINNPTFLGNAKTRIDEMQDFDPDVIFQAAIFEIVTPDVNNVPVPDWVFQEFNQPVQIRNFRCDSMKNVLGIHANNWGNGAGVPDVSRLETRMYFYFLARKYMDIGIEAIHFGQVELMSMEDYKTNFPGWRELLNKIRTYAKTHVPKQIVLCDGHMPQGGLVVNGNLLFDFLSHPMRPVELLQSPQKAELKAGVMDAMYGRTNGGTTPSGWFCERSPYLIELDNYGITDHPGVGSLDGYDVWGYDEITWFSEQPQNYRNEFLIYANEWLRSHDPNGYLQMPGNRVVVPGNKPNYRYRANTKTSSFQEGKSQEETIKSIWSGTAPASGIHSYTLSSKSDVENFGSLSDTIQNLSISGIDVTDDAIFKLKSRIKVIRGTLTIDGTSITTTENFFEYISCKGSIVLKNNLLLMNPNGFKNYTKISGDLIIDNCPDLYYWGSPAGQAGFSKIARIDGSLKLSPVPRMDAGGNGFAALTYVGGNFEINGDPTKGQIWNLDTWYQQGGGIKHIGGNLTYKNHAKVNGLGGFQNLEYLGGDVFILDNGGASTGYIPLQSLPNMVGFCLIRKFRDNGVMKKLNPIIQLRAAPGAPLIDVNTLVPCNN